MSFIHSFISFSLSRRLSRSTDLDRHIRLNRLIELSDDISLVDVVHAYVLHIIYTIWWSGFKQSPLCTYQFSFQSEVFIWWLHLQTCALDCLLFTLFDILWPPPLFCTQCVYVRTHITLPHSPPPPSPSSHSSCRWWRWRNTDLSFFSFFALSRWLLLFNRWMTESYCWVRSEASQSSFSFSST